MNNVFLGVLKKLEEIALEENKSHFDSVAHEEKFRRIYEDRVLTGTIILNGSIEFFSPDYLKENFPNVYEKVKYLNY